MEYNKTVLSKLSWMARRMRHIDDFAALSNWVNLMNSIKTLLIPIPETCHTQPLTVNIPNRFQRPSPSRVNQPNHRVSRSVSEKFQSMTYPPAWPARRIKMKSRPAHCHSSDEQMKPQYILQDDDPMGDSDAPDAEAKITKPTRVDELEQPRIKQSVEPTGLDTTKRRDVNALRYGDGKSREEQSLKQKELRWTAISSIVVTVGK